MSENTQIADKPTQDQPPTTEKLPYVKPELHLINVDGTEGKFFTSKTETTLVTSFGPS
mgnify:CR=1 FL=1